MRLLPKLRALQRRSEASQRRCDAELSQLAREDEGLRHEEDALAAQANGLRQLRETQRETGTVLDRGQLLTLLRKQAVLRHQLQILGLQAEQLSGRRQTLAERRLERQDERRAWQRKEDKYQCWTAQLRKQARLARLREDEAEQEENIRWKP
ncbi:hypothetical protein CFB82_40215 [Burkholderia sp. HI2714]|uniref:hypothetical protein n=1 Tax=Burkholderia sp. HI2714 TaxID=2015359 RepID=UPI000B79BF89|nr:hypothetical protein [Burkholderia sp. HI2714]OXJ22556.1 hypothetical protein CFB82_40215 [Burkholderia sp. HI2714]